jgi:hypothetical protein
MKTMQFRIDIKAPKEKVWRILWDNDNYRKWTSAFTEGSYAGSDRKQSSKISFLSPGGSGIYSTFDKKINNQFMSFMHIGEIKDHNEQPLDEATKNGPELKKTTHFNKKEELPW